MKKYFWMLAIVLTCGVAFTSCGGDDEPTDLEISNDMMALNYGAQNVLSANMTGCTWTSNNEYVATVDNAGRVTGVHVGEATITCTNGDMTATCVVTVNPIYTAWTLPVLNFGANQAKIKADENHTLISELCDAETLVFAANDKLAYPWYIYDFENGKMIDATLGIANNSSAVEDMDKFLKQYYVALAPDEDGDVFYINADLELDADIFAITYPSDDNNTLMTTFEGVQSDAKSAIDVKANLKKAAKRNSVKF